MKSTIPFYLIIILLFSCKSIVKQQTHKSEIRNDVVLVEYPEVYELANIIIALTEDGITDKWKVQKDFSYYKSMRKHFESMKGHALLDSVNFVKERWEEFLSFRTDAYAYQFDDNSQLVRVNEFRSFEISEFDDHIELIQDFADKSNFREFFRTHSSLHIQLIDDYKKNYMLEEMKEFLSNQFDSVESDKKFVVVLSPFVGGQNLQRTTNSNTTVSFVNISQKLINGTDIKDLDKSTIVHTLFTEMNHEFVNPTTSTFDISSTFKNQIWNDDSGYEEYADGVFNEYMTWGLFDIFNTEHFPNLADEINLNWHFQNDTRGFIYSNLFGTKLKKLYYKYDGNKKIKDLYPELIKWTHESQSELSKPELVNNSDTLKVLSSGNLIELEFTEPMKKENEFEIVLQYSQWDRETMTIGASNNLNWNNDGKSLSFEVELPNKKEYYFLLNWWGVSKPLKSEKEITLKATNGFIVIGDSAPNNR